MAQKSILFCFLITIYIQTKGKVKLQGNKIESPDYIIEKNLKPDYCFYITNQIQKPVWKPIQLNI